MSDRLAEIKARLAAATPGPWENDGNGEISTFKNPFRDVVALRHRNHGTDCRGASIAAKYEDLELIAHAPDDIGWLVAEVERLRGEQLGLLAENARLRVDRLGRKFP